MFFKVNVIDESIIEVFYVINKINYLYFFDKWHWEGVHLRGTERKWEEIVWFNPLLIFICVEVTLSLLPTEVDFELNLFQYFFYWSEGKWINLSKLTFFTSKVIFKLIKFTQHLNSPVLFSLSDKLKSELLGVILLPPI